MWHEFLWYWVWCAYPGTPHNVTDLGRAYEAGSLVRTPYVGIVAKCIVLSLGSELADHDRVLLLGHHPEQDT